MCVLLVLAIQTGPLSLYIPNKLRLYYSSRIERGIRDRGSWPLARVRRGHAGEHQHSTLRSKVGRTLEGLATQHFCLVPLHVTLIGPQHSLPRAGRVGLVPSPSPAPFSRALPPPPPPHRPAPAASPPATNPVEISLAAIMETRVLALGLCDLFNRPVGVGIIVKL